MVPWKNVNLLFCYLLFYSNQNEKYAYNYIGITGVTDAAA